MVKNSTKAIIRIITGAVLAVVLARVFRPEAGPVFAAGLFVALVGAAYGLELIHKKDKK
ncbi:MAG: hypothetical protein K9J85_10660 [Desulfobacteraceae bacterium]|nr:hypothetical protein [Desulfobacteraceae bacterium]